METLSCSGSVCPFTTISWLWYAVSVVVVFGVGGLWYGKFFTKKWIAAVDYKCSCGADMAKGEKCACKNNGGSLTMIFQFLATGLVGLMYFLLSWPMALIVAVAMSGWMKATLKFQKPDWKQYFTLAMIDVGYFFLSSIIFILFALI